MEKPKRRSLDQRRYIRKDVGYPNNPKISELSDAAYRLHDTAMCYAGEQMTDGFVGRRKLEQLATKRGAVKELVARGLLEPGKGPNGEAGYLIHDYLEHNYSREEIEGFCEGKRRGGNSGMHTRWHVNRKQPNPECSQCVAEGLVPPNLRIAGG